MSEKSTVQSRNLPGKIDVYVLGEDGSVSVGAGCMPNVFISEQDAGRIYEKDVAQFIFANFGRVLGVMRDTEYDTAPSEYKTRKMILGKVNLS